MSLFDKLDSRVRDALDGHEDLHRGRLDRYLKPTLAAPEEDATAADGLLEKSAHARTKHLDVHTRGFIAMAREALNKWERPAAEVIVAPKEDYRGGKMATTKLPFANIILPSYDEDWTGLSHAKEIMLWVLRKLPLADHDDEWSSADEAKEAFNSEFPGILSPPAHVWEEMTSDAAQSRLAFVGMGAIRLYPLVDTSDPDGATWVSDLTFMDAFEVRAGFERYGAAAYFNAKQEIVRIYLPALGQDFRPGDTGWEHAKWVWRCTILIGTTVAVHLVSTHWLTANVVTYATRSSFGVDHSIRRLLKVFTWRSATINYSASYSLCPERGFVHRGSALTYDALTSAYAASSVRDYFTTPELIKRKNPTPGEVSFPWAEDALSLYEVIHRFVTDYVEAYLTEASVLKDNQFRDFWATIEDAKTFNKMPDLSRDELVNVLAQFIWTVTGFHEAVGNVMEYAINPTHMGTKIRRGATMADAQASFQSLCIVALTGLKMPALMNDFRHVLPDDGKGRPIFVKFQDDLRQLSEEIQLRNSTRGDWACHTFDPQYLETGVSI